MGNILQLLPQILDLIKEINGLLQHLKDLGIDFSGVKVHTTAPVDLSKLVH
jgi:hypothetical protein